MNQNKNLPSLRLLLLITHSKFADKASKMFAKTEMPMHYKMNAVGTASSEMMDILGLGSSEKSIIASVLPKNLADDILKRLHKELRLGSVNSGIAFTAKLSAVSNLIVKMYENNNISVSDRKDDSTVTESGYSLIAAIVNPGFSEEVMNVAREAGAGGGSVIHSRRIADETAVTSWGLDIQEEKEIVLIVTDVESKAAIMQAIGKSCGIHSEAKGFVLALPIETVIGLD
ncbi:MAG: hypothetical protein UIG59_05915 [Acutalibacteraceae bacterium]|nr:hypothetical protein [Acutalibacteraceae bacterium]